MSQSSIVVTRLNMTFELSKLKTQRPMNDEGGRVSAILIKDGKSFCTAEDGGYGAPMHFEPLDGFTYDDIHELNKVLGQTVLGADKFNLTDRLEFVVDDLIKEHGREKEYQKTLKRLGYLFEGKVNVYPARFKPDADSPAFLKGQSFWTKDHKTIQEASREDVLKAIYGN